MKRLIPACLLVAVAAMPVARAAAAPLSKASMDAARKAVDELLRPEPSRTVPRDFSWPRHAVEVRESVDWEKGELVAAGVSRRRGRYAEALDLASFQALAAARLSAFQRLLVLAVDERRTLGDVVRAEPQLGTLVEDLLARLPVWQQSEDDHGLVRVSVRLALAPVTDLLVPLLHPGEKEETGKDPTSAAVFPIRIFTGAPSYSPGLLPPLRALGEEASRKLGEALGRFLRLGGRPRYESTPRGFLRGRDFTARSLGGVAGSTLYLDDGDALALAALLAAARPDACPVLEIVPGPPVERVERKEGSPAGPPSSR